MRKSTENTMQPVSATVEINEVAALADLASACNFSDTTLLDRDYKRCAETMISNFGSNAVQRAERRAQEMLGDGNPGGCDIWTRVAATIRQAQANERSADQGDRTGAGGGPSLDADEVAEDLQSAT
jgi:hypothetical protein